MYSRRHSGAATRPSAASLGDKTVMTPTISLAVVLAIPSLLFALGGILLWRRRPSVGSTMVALGFCASFISHLVSLFESVEYQALVNTPGDEPFFVTHQQGMTLASHDLALLGAWAASIGLLLYARTLIRASPNQRLEPP